ncbi:MAG: hypothetical protein CRN43_00470 [Candidatus Nephrothrix sp. EaCA]|nr:MAG: hypothetical protein CRN43_00470 [Candidatus Nephrothrix sp. EaCA]
MQTPDSLNLVRQFHEAFDHPMPEKPLIPAENRCRLRVSLLAEELKELEQAIEHRDLEAVADALCDLQYVLSGAVLEFGLGEKFEALFNEVQRSNMSKACLSEEEAKKTATHYKESKNVASHYVRRGDKWLVYRTEDNKTLKSITYSPANLARILESK